MKLFSTLLFSTVLFISSGGFAQTGTTQLKNAAFADRDYCIPYINSNHTRQATKTTHANPSNWINVINNAIEHEEVLLEDGVYPLEHYAVVFNSAITLRSASGDRSAVIIEGKGYGENAEALMVMADDVHIADITVRNVRDHAITFQEGFAGTIVYNVDLVDIGTQHIKGNRMGPGGLIACSNIGYTEDGVAGDYNGGIDLHGAVNWTIRDNTIYNIFGDGSGCIVDSECGSMFPGGEPAILLWRESRDNIIERNRIINSFRAISLGLDTPYSGGAVRDNFICRNHLGREGINGFITGDAGISLLSASKVIVEGNTVILPGDYPGQIEIRDGTGLVIKNNITGKEIWDRGNTEYNQCEGLDCSDEKFHNSIRTDWPDDACIFEKPVILATVSSDTTEIDQLAQNTVAANSVSEDSDSNKPVKQQATDQVSTSDELLTERADALDLKEERLLALEQQLNDANQKLRIREEQLQIRENQLSMQENIRTLELQQRSSQYQIDIINQRLQKLENE